MAYPIERKLVVAVSSNALFDLEKEDEIFQKEGLQAYKAYQYENKHVKLNKGLAFPFIKRFLHINKVYSDKEPVEVVLLSKNSPEIGIRIFNAIKEYDLNITRAAFTSGESPYKYIPAYNISLFLSVNEKDVLNAIEANYAAGRILKTNIKDDDDLELRVAFDFDGVIADDEAEKVYAESKQLEIYYEYETKHRQEALNPGPLGDFFRKLSYFQKMESKKAENDLTYKKILKTAIITARNAPAHERAINTLKEWKVEVDEMFLLGGIEKKRILEVMKPHLFFDDQLTHLDPKLENIPLVHIPFGIQNKSIEIKNKN
ncbi:MAG: 5'-nucleotidase [Ignavibacteria bacterium]